MLAQSSRRLDVDRAIEQARVAERRSRWLGVDAGALLALGIPGFLVSLPFGVALAAGGGVLGVCALVLRSHRNELISRLAVHRAAYAWPAVVAYGAKSASPEQVELMSAWLREMVENCTEPHTWCATPRVCAYRDEIATLADELASPHWSVSPEGAVECKRLLTRGVESPLYNQEVPEEDLRAALFRIRGGISAAAVN